MPFESDEILAVLDRCCNAYNFPMLDNGYIYLAATRLSLYRSMADWAIVIEVFGFSPRAGLPDTCIQTFASRPHNRKTPEDFISDAAYKGYIASNPHNDAQLVFPIHEGPWQDADTYEIVSEGAKEVIVREKVVQLPSIDEYARHEIELEHAPQVQTFELCRFLAGIMREQVLATPQERRVNVLPEMQPILQLEEWNHPDLVNDQRPSKSVTFQQLAQVLATGDIDLYRPSLPPNMHWRNWPDGGRL